MNEMALLHSSDCATGTVWAEARGTEKYNFQLNSRKDGKGLTVTMLRLVHCLYSLFLRIYECDAYGIACTIRY